MIEKGNAISGRQVQAVVVSDEGNIQALIKPIRGVQVILDRDVARLYGVATGALNRQVKRNEERFPEDFMFRLSVEEWDNLKCQIGISSWGGDRQLPYAFTENGIAMLSSVLRSPTAIEVRFLIIDDKELYLINAPKKREPRFEGEIRRRRTRRALKRPRASLKDLGSKCFAFTKLDTGEIRRIKRSAFEAAKAALAR